MDGDEVIQVYLKRIDDTDGPIKALRAFKRTSIKAGESKVTTIPLDYKSFEWFNPQTNTICTTPGEFEVLYGSSSKNEDLQHITINVQ